MFVDMFHVSIFFFFKQKTAYEMRISDWSSDVCSSDLVESRKRRCEFLRAVVAELGLAHVEIAEAPLERVATRSAATISARAFAPLDRLLDLSARFSTESTRWLLPKEIGSASFRESVCHYV